MCSSSFPRLASPVWVSHPGERSRHGRRSRFPCHATKELIIKEKLCPANAFLGRTSMDR